MRRPAALTALAALVAASLSGCVFVPGLVGQDDPEPPVITDVGPAPSPDDTDETDDTGETDDTDVDESDDPNSSYGLSEWPDEVPKPQGEEYPSDDPSLIMVEGDQAAYDSYVAEIKAAGFTADYDTGDDESLSWWTNGEYRVLVMNLDPILSVTVTEEYF